MYFLLDILIIAIYVLIMWYFKNKGFLKASETVVSLILTFSLMPVCAPIFEDFIDKSVVGEEIHKKVEMLIVGDKTDGEMIILPDVLKEGLDKAEDMKDSVIKNTANHIAGVIIRVLSFILLYILIKLVIFLVFRILILVCRLRFFGFFNKFFGMVFGFLDATIIIYLACALAFIFIPADSMKAINEGISTTILANFFYNENILINLLL